MMARKYDPELPPMPFFPFVLAYELATEGGRK